MRKLHRLLMAALVLVPLTACDEGDDVTPIDDPAVGTVSGTVQVEGSGLAGVTVQLAGASSQSTTTGSNGAYSFANVVEGNYSVTLSSIPGDVVFSNTTQSVTIASDGQTATADFNGQYVRTASILVNVTRADGSGVVTNIRVQGAGVDQTLGTNAQGTVTFSGLRSGEYTVTMPNPPAEGFDDTPTTQTVQVNTGQAVQVNFVGDTQIVPPEIAITRITSAATTNPADPDSIAGRVEVTLGVRPNGNSLQTVELWVKRQSTGEIWKIAEQRFAAGAPEAQFGDNEGAVTFSWNSDAIRRKNGSHPSIRMLNSDTGEFEAISSDAMRPFHPVFINGDYEIHGRVTVAEMDAAQTAVVDVTLENQDAINLGVISDNTDWEDPTTGVAFPNFIIQETTGLRWLSGDIVVDVYPIIYSQEWDPNNPLLARANFAFDAFQSGQDKGFGGQDLATPNPNGSFTFAFCEHPGANSTAGVTCYDHIDRVNTGLIGARNIVVQTKTAFGQFGPGYNDAAGVNNIKSIEFFNEDLQSGSGVLNDVLRIDNEAPSAATVSTDLPHPADEFTGVDGFSRTTLAGVNNLGWVNWKDRLDDLIGASPDDHPRVYPATDKGGNPVTAWVGYDANLSFAPGQNLNGIGNPTGDPGDPPPYQTYIAGPNVGAGVTPASIVGAPDLAKVSTEGPVVGADLPPEQDSPDLIAVGSADGTPFSNTETDYAMAGRHWDQFGNRVLTENHIFFGVDGRKPIFSNAAGTTDPDASLALADPTVAGTQYNTFDDEHYVLDRFDYDVFGNEVWSSASTGTAPFNLGKARGSYAGYTTDRGNGYSGIAGVVVEDWEARCATGTMACSPASATDVRWGFTLQPTGTGPTSVLAFVFDGQMDVNPVGGDTFEDVAEPGRIGVHNVGTDFRAYVAAQDVASQHDGYRQHTIRSYDRAGNVRIDESAREGIADHTAPNVGNVQMPTAVTFNLADPYTFHGENLDNADLKASDLSFDFNSILSLQLYSSPSAASHPNPTGVVPPVDVDGAPYGRNSLQLPLENVVHTAFGSQDIYLGGNLSVTTEFIGCLVRADEAGLATQQSSSTTAGTLSAEVDAVGAEPRVHRPRGPRWRTWDHSSEYGLVNTQFNTFVQTSIPDCLDPLIVAANFEPALGVVGPDGGAGPDGIFGNQDDDASWIFNLDDQGRPRITFKGPASTFVPNIEPDDDIEMYYLDTAGRVRLLDSSNFSLRVTDVGTGAFGRWYEYTLVNDLPSDLIDPADIPADNGTVETDGWFFIVKGSTTNGNDGHAIIWDGTANPPGTVTTTPITTDGTVETTPGATNGRYQFTATANTGYLVQSSGATPGVMSVFPVQTNTTSVADNPNLLGSYNLIAWMTDGGSPITSVTAGPMGWVGEVNVQECVVTNAAVGDTVQVTLDAATDCALHPGTSSLAVTPVETQMVRVTLSAGTSYTVTVAGGTNPGFVVVGPDGTSVLRGWEVLDNNPEVRTFTAADSGTHIILVHGDLGGGDVGVKSVTVQEN